MKEKHQRSGHRDTSFTPSEHQRLTFGVFGKMGELAVNGHHDDTLWINEEFFLDLLNISDDSNAEVKINNISRAVPLGNNYLGTVWRVDTTVLINKNTEKQQSFIIKDLPKGEVLRKFMRESGVFDKEYGIYKKILPKMYDIAKEALPIEYQKPLSAKSYTTSKEEILVLEDLRPSGYKMGNRLQGLDFEHCVIVLKTLAKFHALSIALWSRDPSIMDDCKENIYVEERKEKYAVFVERPFLHLAKVVEKWSGYERFGDKLRNIASQAYDKMTRDLSRKSTDYCVLNHGDLHINNMLFCYSDNGKVVDVKFVDFQLSRFASFALDLHYFLGSSTNKNVRESTNENLLKEYHNELCKILELLGCSSRIMTFDQLKQEMKDKLFYSLFVSSNIMPIIVADPNDTPDFSNLKEEDMENEEASNPTDKAVKGSRFREIFKHDLLMLEENGVL